MAKTTASQKASTAEKTATYETSSSWGKLSRSNTDRMLAGVCGGLAQYFGIDSTLIRLVFVLMLIFGGSGFLVYLVLWIIIPSATYVSSGSSEETIKANIAEMKDKAKELGESFKSGSDNPSREDSNRSLWGVLVIGFGIILLLKNFGFFQGIDLGNLWPVALILLGVALLGRNR